MSRQYRRGRSLLETLNPFSRRVDRALEWKRSRGTYSRRLGVEHLEQRQVLSVTLIGAPLWVPEGPGPILNGQVENIPSPNVLGDDPVSGAVHTILVDPSSADIMYAGAVNGGVWKTTNATNAAGPTWTPLTDQFPSLSISSLEFDPTDATNQTIVAGVGAYSSFGALSGPMTGLLRTTDGGNTWTQLGNSPRATPGNPGGLQGVSVAGLAVRGNSIMVAASNRGAGAGVYYSNDGGETFNFISGLNGLPNVGQPLDLVADPGNNNRLYVAIGGSAAGGVFRTDNATAAAPTWTNATDATLAAALSGNANNFELAVSAAPGNPIYAGVITNGQLNGVFRSANMGASWTAMDIPRVLAGNNAIAVGNMTGNGVGPIVITAPNHGLSAGENPQVRITGSTGNTAANGDFFVTLVDPDGGGPLTTADGFSLNGTVGNGNYTGGAVWSSIVGIQPREKPGSQGNTHFSIAADPTNPNLVYLGGDRQDFPNNALGANDVTGSLWRGDFSVAPGGAGVVPSPQWAPLTHTGTNTDSSPHADSRDIRFRPNGDIVEVDDGGVYLRTNPQGNNGGWFSLHGNMQNTELHDIAYDSNSNIIIGGAQDVGTPQQFSAGSFTWNSVSTADGGDVAVDNIALAGAGQSIRYSSAQDFGGARRRTYDAAGNFVAGSDVTLALTLVGGGTPIMQGAAGNVQFVTPIATNDVVGNRLVIGGANNLWESTDLGNTVTELFATGGVSLGANRTAIAAGGMMGGVPNPDVLYVGSGNQVFVRTTAGGNLTATSPPGIGNVLDVAIHPEDWMTAFAIDIDSVFMTTDGGSMWTDITGDLADTALRTISVVAGAAADAVLVGGNLGVSRLITSAMGMWSEFGVGLPNAPVHDMDYDSVDDILVVGTMGRGAWSLDDVSAVVFSKGVLQIDGDMDFAGQDDVIRLVRDAGNPNLLHVFINGMEPTDSPYQLDSIQQINVNGLGGNDTLIVDSSNGLITVDMGIRWDGGLGLDQLTLDQAMGEGDVQTSETLMVGATAGSGVHTIVGPTGTQQVTFQRLEPINTNVPVLSFTINGALIGSLLNGANQITYDVSDVFGVTWGRVTADAFEPVHFINKTAVTIDAENGDDTIVINNSELPTGLTSLTVMGDGGHDEIRLEALPDATATTYDTTVVSGGAGNDTIDGSAIVAGTPLVIDGNAGSDTITGGAGVDTIQGGSGDDIIIDSPGNDTVDGGVGEDLYVIRGNSLNNTIQVTQNAPSAVVADLYTLTVLNLGVSSTKNIGKTAVSAPSDAANRPTIERILIEGLSGSDQIAVTQADAYSDLDLTNGVVLQTIPITVDGGTTGGDRLLVNDAGLGDLVIQRVSADARDGSFQVGGMAPVEYTGIEFPVVSPVNPITGGTGTDGMGRLAVFKFDPFEINDTLPTATFLGAGPTVNADPTIDPSGFDGFPGDNDFYQFVAQETGTLDLQLYFEPIGTLGNGRPGLFNNGELTVTAYDSDGLPIAIGTASDLLDPAGNKIGERITLPVVRNNTYYLRVQGEVLDGVSAINVYNFTGITVAAPIPELVDLQAASDSGRHNGDNITKITTPTFDIILDDDRIDEFMNIDLVPDTVDDDLQTLNNGIGQRIDYGVEVFNNGVSIGFAFYTGLGNTWRFTATAGDLNEGDFNHISAAVWIRDRADPAVIGRHLLSQSLQITLDTITPPVAFGLPDAQSMTDGLVHSTDSGVITTPALYADRVTSDTTPTLWGIAEADTVVRVFLDINNNGIIDLGTDILLGQDVAIPEDGNVAFPNGYWEITSVLDLNQLAALPKDGVRRLLVTAEDVAGNPMPMNGQIADGIDELNIFLDTQGPQVFDPPGPTQPIFIPGFEAFDLFDPKPSENGYTPLINQLTINIRDLPFRSNIDPNFLYVALQEDVAEALGNYVLVGDHVGTIGIVAVDVVNAPPVNGQQATATVTLTFAAPLPDDRYTLTLKDGIVDPAGNRFDGESNANGPLEDPFFPSGDGVPGGNFVARFTVDSRPEIGSYIPTTISIDINGNFVWDPANGQIGNDFTNVDLTFNMQLEDPVTGSPISGGFGVHDLVFAGQFFVPPPAGAAAPARPFDQLAVFGALSQSTYRWLIDRNSDGVVNPGEGDIFTLQPRFVGSFDTASAIPVAGDFDNDATNGDEIGLYNAGRWALDTNRNFIIDAGDTFINSNLFGNPIVGDFNGDGLDDLAVHNSVTHLFSFDLNRNGTIDDTIEWGFPGVLEIPVAADMNQDGIDDIGLWVPRNSTQVPRTEAEWFFLISDGSAPVGFNVDNLNHAFEIVPFGTDITAHFGDEGARPIVGNFDPPVTATGNHTPTPEIVFDVPGDFNQDGTVDVADHQLWKSQFGQTGTGLAGDGNGDGVVDALDFVLWRNNLGKTAADFAAVAMASPVVTSSAETYGGMELTLPQNVSASDAAHETADAAATQTPVVAFRPSGRSSLASGAAELPPATIDALFADTMDDLLLYGTQMLEEREPSELDDLFDLFADDDAVEEAELPLTL